MTIQSCTDIRNVTASKLADQFVIWAFCYNLNPFDNRLWVSSANGFSIEVYGELMSEEQAANMKRIVWEQRTAQHPLNNPHYTLPHCG
jgi:hypothetical protein